MGLIGWIKKEIESSSRQRRRQSAPPPLIHLSNADQNRDEAYLRAISKFNEWRNHQRFERLNETKNTSAFTQQDMMSKTYDDVSITDVEIKDDEKKRLVRARKKQQAVYSNCNPEEVNRNKRLSLSIMHVTNNNNNGDRKERRKIAKLQQPTSTIEEIEEFEQKHCQKKIDEYSFANPSTPPSKFYHNNSDPYDDQRPSSAKKTTPDIKKQTPKRLMGRNMLRRNKGKAPQPPSLQHQQQTQHHQRVPPIREDETSESILNFYNGNFKHYDVSTTSCYDEFVISSKAYKGQLRNEKVNLVGESAESSGSLSSDPDKNIKKQRRLSPPYQTVINKHGDEVEYALPYNERDSMNEIPPLPTAPMPKTDDTRQMPFDQIIDQNFKFLNSKLDFLNSQIDNDACMLDRKASDTIFDPIDASFSDVRRNQNLQVTDLDRSNDTGLAFPAQTGDILKDLDALSKWTENYRDNDENYQSPMALYQVNQKGIKTFNSHDIKYKSGALRNSFSTPLEFSNGYFHKTPITLRSTLPNNYSISNFAELACKREFEILCQIKHFCVVTMMGICFDMDLRVTSLVMEPFDYTLNHYLHQMDKFYNIQQTVSVIHQIASAAQYLNECGFVHSNISSHAVLVRDHPFAVKLSSFELATEILPRQAIGKIYHLKNVNECAEIVTQESSDSALNEKYCKLSKQHFYNRTSLPMMKHTHEDLAEHDDNEYRLPYSIPYRRMFSMHYYQAPELLIPTTDDALKYVMPTPQADVYGLALLLWESINRAVPYVIFNHDELIRGLTKGKVQLPMLDKSSILFKEIFESCLHVESSKRISDVEKFITLLEDLRLLGYEKDKLEVLEIVEPSSERKTEKNIKNSDQRDKLREKIYFSNSEIDPQRRLENVVTTDTLTDIQDNSVQSAEFEPHIMSFDQQPGILQDDAVLERIRKTVEDQRGITPKKPLRKRDDEAEMSKNSTMFQSFFDFNRLQTPKIDKDVIYERTSTLKKRLKGATDELQRKTVRGLFDDKAVDIEMEMKKKELNDQFDKMNAELSLIVQGYDKNDFMQEIVKELQDRKETVASSFLNQGMKAKETHELTRSFEKLPNEDDVFSKIRRSESDFGDSYSLPHTPIARQNMIRRNAWLSDGQKTLKNTVSDEIAKRSINFINNNSPKSGNKKQYNVNIKIHHNDLDTTATTTPKDKSTNVTQNNSSVKIKLYNSATAQLPIIKINNVDLNKTSYTEDINKKYYPNMPEMLSDVIQNKRDKSLIASTCENDGREYGVKLRKKKSVSLSEDHHDDEEKVIVPLPMKVRDTIKLIENTFSHKDDGSKLSASRKSKTMQKSEETQTDEIAVNDGKKSLMQASESIQKLDEMFANINSLPSQPPPFIVNKNLEHVVNHATIHTQTPKKITTKVTVNLKKISGRSSDVSQLKYVQSEQARHSVCNSAELIKRLQMHLKGSGELSKLGQCMSASCSNLASKDGKNDEITPLKQKIQKYFCRNCGFTMTPAEILKRMQSQGRISISSSVADGLHSIQYDESLQSLAAIRKCQKTTESRSTEDLYIDDDFCQGITQSLAANMELLPPPDFFDSLDFNILSAEIFHTQEHEFDETLTENEKLMILNGDNEDNNDEEVEAIMKENEVPICDGNEIVEKKQDIDDEPKV